MRRLRHLIGLTLVALFLVLAGGTSAQLTDEARQFHQSWLSFVERAERVIDTERASSASFEKLRLEFVDYREAFARARDRNTDRITTLEAQLQTLGPKPENGDEPEDIAQLRDSLNSQLDTLRVPRIISEEAHSRANGLINEIDQIIRARQTQRLMSRGPSPLNPQHWPNAWDDVRDALTALVNETRSNLRAASTRAKIRRDLPAILILFALGVTLLVLGRRWSEGFGNFLRRLGGRGTGVWSFIVSLTRIALPLLGTILLVQAVIMTGILGVRGALVAEEIPVWALTLLAFKWLSDQLYGHHRDTDLLPSPKDRRGEMIIYVNLLAVTLVLKEAIILYGQIENISDASRAVVSFPVILGAALILLRLQNVGLSEQKAASQDGTPGLGSTMPSRTFRAIRRGAVILAMVAPVLAALGYGTAAEAIVYPVILSLVLVSIILILQRFFGDVYVWLRRAGDGAANDTLFSSLVGFALILASVPVFALIWGARPAEITELWSRFLDGFQMGDTRISPMAFLTFALIFVAGYTVTKLLKSGLRTSLLPKTKIDPGGQNAIVAFTGYAGIFLAALIAVSATGLDLSSLAIVAGALSVGIGFGLQTIVSNFVSGIILLIERPIAKGDWIEVSDYQGYVRDISVRATRIETFDRTDVIVPNSDLIAGIVTNFTLGKTVGRVIVPVGVAYGTDTRVVESILREVAEAHPMVLANPPPFVVFQGFGADALDFEIRAILRDVNWVLSVRSDMNHEIAKRFTEAGIEIPFAQRDIWLRNPEVLSGKRPESDLPESELPGAELPAGQADAIPSETGQPDGKDQD